ncbi:MAG TPA: hypothetical protein DEG90_00785, partial [Porphyromonadaceae bacterium]|nr:hypothetical protein [Porphyromonadaceae bacterium]
MGAIGVINAGWKISDCSNRGDVTASNGSSTAYAYGFSSKTSAGKTKESLVTIERCFNSGEVRGNGAGISGFIGDLAKFGYMSDCYNTGDVYSIGSNPANGALTAGGLVGKMNGVMERCFNAGDV